MFIVNWVNLNTEKKSCFFFNLNNRSWGLFWPQKNITRHYFLIGWTYSFIFYNILTNTEDISNVMTLFHCDTRYAHDTRVENDPNYHLYSKFSNFDLSASCLNGLNWPSEKQRKWWFIYWNRFTFDEMVAILPFMYRQDFNIMEDFGIQGDIFM